MSRGTRQLGWELGGPCTVASHIWQGGGGRARESLNDEVQVHDGSFASGNKYCILFILQYLHS